MAIRRYTHAANVQPVIQEVHARIVPRDMITIKKPDVIKLMLIDVVPEHRGDGVFILRVRLNNNTQVSLNGIKITYLGDELFKNIPLNKITLKEIALKRYSSKTRNQSSYKEYCYATKALFKIKVSK